MTEKPEIATSTSEKSHPSAIAMLEDAIADAEVRCDDAVYSYEGGALMKGTERLL